jgi:hypothetical protein
MLLLDVLSDADDFFHGGAIAYLIASIVGL